MLCFIKDEWTLASTEPVIFVLGDNENCSVGLSSSVMDEHLLEYEPVEGFVAGAFKYSLKKIRKNSRYLLQKSRLGDVPGGRGFSMNDDYIRKIVKGWLARAGNPSCTQNCPQCSFLEALYYQF